MQATPQTILCATISAGKPAAGDGLADCIRLLCETAEACGGRVSRTMTGRIVALYATPDAAAGAAAKMHAAMAARPAPAGAKLEVRIAFHNGPLTGTRNGQNLKVVLRLVARAKSGQVLTTQSTAELLSTSFRAFSRHLQAAPLRAAGAMAGIYEVSWRPAPARQPG